MATSIGHVMNLANSIIGVSLLAMPFCFKQCGITLAIVMLLLSSIVSRLSCHFLVKSSITCRRRNFESLAFYTFGPSGKLLVELGVIGFMMGTCVAFFVVMGDLGPAIISKMFNIKNSDTLRTSILIGLGVFVILPLGLLRNVESLAAISTVTIVYYMLFILKIFFEATAYLVTGDWWHHVKFWQPEGILQCIPIFAMALSCQTQLFEIYNSLSSPTIEKMNSVVRSALILCTIVYTSVGLFGYIAYCKGSFTGNILLSFAPSLSSELFKLGFVLSVAVSFPLVIFPCRASLFSLLFKRMPINHDSSQTSSHIPDSRFKCLTLAIVLVALVTGILIPSIELVLGFVGSTIGVAISIVFPCLSFINLYNKNTNEKVMAKVTLILGLIIMILGTFGNLFAAVEHKPIQMAPGKLSEAKNLHVKIEVSTEVLKKNDNKGVLLVNPIPPEEFLLAKPPERIKTREQLKERENLRKEPPIPVAPEQRKSEVKPQIKVIENQIFQAEKDKNVGEHLDRGSKKLKNLSLTEKINNDAIDKEKKELMEVEKHKKTEEDKKQEELLKILKEHQNEQKKLLREQEKILIEMKNRENEKKAKIEKEEKKNAKFLEENVKTIRPEIFKADLNKIENYIENLKDTKKKLEKKGLMKNSKDFISQNVSYFKEKAKKLENENMREMVEAVHSNLVDEEEARKEVGPKNHPVASMPLPLAKLRVQSERKEEAPVRKKSPKSKQELLARDILVEKISAREKRDLSRAEGNAGECEKESSISNFVPINKTETVKIGGAVETEVPNNVLLRRNSSALIMNSVHLSVEFPKAEAPKITQLEAGDHVGQSFLSKKRDLKSVRTDDD